MSTYAKLKVFRLNSFNCRTIVKILILVKYMKNENQLGIVGNSESTRKNIPANIKMYSTQKSGLQPILNVTISLYS